MRRFGVRFREVDGYSWRFPHCSGGFFNTALRMPAFRSTSRPGWSGTGSTPRRVHRRQPSEVFDAYGRLTGDHCELRPGRSTASRSSGCSWPSPRPGSVTFAAAHLRRGRSTASRPRSPGRPPRRRRRGGNQARGWCCFVDSSNHRRLSTRSRRGTARPAWVQVLSAAARARPLLGEGQCLLGKLARER